ncbi:uncharacterized protein LOC127718132 [Mytilus californianus]|uniref:uncharacterized protein LOC127718132 n=1 Tax=Mytilus californianus TaxID=6549 RepID=UPI002245D12E|nr:uncharacterized protein LOC127718132 [Mytilus californianus]XP_052080050.1 uncharacterized protein LOC127718132 [Mytilus californianus]XP_052080051.1 uncharacterized protein LOC127718132 [Mytilus californianus]
MERSAMHSVCGESVVQKSGQSDTEYVVYVLEDNKLKRVSSLADVADVASTSTSTSVTSLCHTTWDDKSMKLLLEHYREMEDSKKPVKNKWQLMSDKMKRFNYDFSSEQCRLKIKSLKEKQLRNQKLSDKSGEGNPEEDTIDEKLDEVFSNQPDVNPVHVLQSKEKPGASEEKRKDKVEGEKRKKTEDSGDSEEAGSKGKKKKRMEKGEVDERLDNLQKTTERHHKEKMEVFKEFTSILRDLVPKK